MAHSLAESIEKIRTEVSRLTTDGGQFQLGEEAINGTVYKVYRNAPATLGALYQMMQLHGDRDFLVYREQRLSFAEVYRRAAALAHSLRDRCGIQKRERVAIAMRNNPEWCIAFIAITAIGAVAVPMNSWWTGEELDYALRDCEAKLLIGDGPRLERLLAFRRDTGLALVHAPESPADSAPVEATPFDTLLAQERDTFPPVEVGADDWATIFYTSGSTGRPKGALSSHRGILSALMSWALMSVANHAAGFGEDLTDPNKKLAALVTVPFFHVTGSHAIFLLSIASGRKLVLMYKWGAEQALQLIERERITYFNGVPTMSQELLGSPAFSRYDTSSLEEVFAGGAARPPEHARRIAEDFGLNAGAAYGLTETNGLGCVISGAMYQARPASTGPVTPAVTEIKIVDGEGRTLPPNEPGEICIKSPANILCYWNNPEATRKAFTDGWFHTGDIGYLDELGLLYIVDRLKDIIIRGGENISCLEVEAAIYAHPAVAEAAVIGLPDERLGEKVAAVIYPKPGLPVCITELAQMLESKIARFKIPEHFEISETPLPRTATGKIHKPGLRERLAESVSA